MDTFVGTCDEDGGHVCGVAVCSRGLAKVSAPLAVCKEFPKMRGEFHTGFGGSVEEDEDEVCQAEKVNIKSQQPAIIS